MNHRCVLLVLIIFKYHIKFKYHIHIGKKISPPPPESSTAAPGRVPTGTLGSLGSARSSSSSVERFTLPWIRENSSQNHQILMDFQNWYYIFIGITRRRPFSHFQFGIIIGCNIPKCPNFQAIPSRKVRGLPLKIFKWMVLHQN